MKKVSILILSIALILTLALIGKGPVKAKTDSYIDTKVEVNIPNSTSGNGCFISFYEWFNEPEDYINFLKISFNIDSQDFIQILLEGSKNAQKLGYIDKNATPCILYISSEELLNKWLRDNAYIEYGATYKDGITGVNLSNGLHYAKTGYDALHELLQLKGELQAYPLNPNNVPDVFYRKNVEASTYSDTWYTFSDLKKPYIINGTWQYKVLEYDGPVEECSIIELPNSVGKVKQVSSNAYEYVYSEVHYNDEFGYYALSQNDTKTMQLSKSQLPTFVFDSNGKILDIYISKQGNLWTCPEVKDVSDFRNGNYRIKREYYYTSFQGSSDSGDDFYLFVAYLNFDIPMDTIEKIEFKYHYWNQEEKYNPFKALLVSLGWSEYKKYEVNCTIYRDTKVIEGNSVTWYRKVLNTEYPYTFAITKSDYYIDNTYYSYRICLSDDNFIPKNYAEKDYYTSYPIEYAPINDLELLNLEYSYRSILYKTNNVNLIPDDGDNDPNHGSKWYDELWKFILKIWNSNLFGKILIILIALLLLFPVIYVVIKLLKLLSKFFKIKKNKST